MINKEKGANMQVGALIFFLALVTLILILLGPLIIIILAVLIFGKPIRFRLGGKQELYYTPKTLYKMPLISGQVYCGRCLREDNGLLHFQEPSGAWQTIRTDLVQMDRIRPSTF